MWKNWFETWCITHRLFWLDKNKKATINPENNDAKCFQYAVTVAINHEKIIKYPQRIAKPKSFINNYN